MINKEYRTNEIISQYCLSRMLVGKSIENDFCTQSLVITIQVNNKKNSETLKLTLYKRLYKLLYGSAEDKRFANFSLLIAGDVEGTREGYAPLDTLKKPIYPHYHCLMMFSKSDWTRIAENFDEWRIMMVRTISAIREVKGKEIRITKFDRRLTPEKFQHQPLLYFTSYCTKCDRIASAMGISDYGPSVYPFDGYVSEHEFRQQSFFQNQFKNGLKI